MKVKKSDIDGKWFVQDFRVISDIDIVTGNKYSRVSLNIIKLKVIKESKTLINTIGTDGKQYDFDCAQLHMEVGHKPVPLREFIFGMEQTIKMAKADSGVKP